MSNIDLHAVLPVLARALADDSKIDVTFSGTGAYAVPGRINLPELSPDNPESTALGLLYVNHEIGHIRYTDFEVEHRSPAHHGICNALEDVRIEECMCRAFKGSRMRLEKGYGLLSKKMDVDALPPLGLIQIYLVARLKQMIAQSENMMAVADKAAARLREVMPDTAVLQLEVLMLGIKHCRHTRDVANLADQILKLFEDLLNQEEPPQASDESSKNQENTSGGAGSGDTQNSPTGESDTSAMTQFLQAILDAEDGEANFELSDVIAESLAGCAKQDQNAGTAITLPKAYFPKELKAVSNLQAVRKATNGLRTRLTALLESYGQTAIRYANSGRARSDRVWELRSGHTRIFERTESVPTLNTAVMCLVDASGSMASNSRLEIAKEAMQSLAMSLDGVRGVSFCAAAFPVPEDRIGVANLLQFGENYRLGIERMSAFEANGSTPLAEAMTWAAVELLSENVNRRILLVATDGEPDDRNKTLKAIEFAERHGIEVIGIGIQHNVSRIYKCSRSITQVTELPTVLFQALQRSLLHAA